MTLIENQPENQTKNTNLIGLVTAVCLVIANMVGTGVFTSLGFQVLGIQSGFSLLFLWLVGGIFALCGALSYGELGSVMPRSGGEYHYLSKIYHPAIGFLSGWLSVTVGFAAPIAAAAMALGKYSASVFPGVNEIAIALIAVIGVSLIHTQNVKLGGSFQQIFTYLKVALIVILIICGFIFATPQDISFLPNNNSLSDILSSSFAISLVYVTYSYSGWNAAIYLASEVKEPEKNVPRSLLIGTAIVMVLYLLLNFIFLYAAPIEEMAGQVEVGAIAAKFIFGESGGKIMAFLIAFGLISSISSMVLAGPRVTQVIGEDIPIFKILAKKNKNSIPYYALLLQLFIVIILVITSSFDAIITYLGFTLTLSSLMTVIGVFVHRYKYPDLPRPYKTWGYPITPIIFSGISLWILAYVIKEEPITALWGLGTILLGLIVYFISAQKKLA
jgi:basic amino acid/polyamine antiporter, APA family